MIKLIILLSLVSAICAFSSAYADPSGKLSGQYSIISGGPSVPLLRVTFNGETAKTMFNHLSRAVESHQSGGPWGVTVRESNNMRCVGTGEVALTQFECSLAVQEDGTILR